MQQQNGTAFLPLVQTVSLRAPDNCHRGWRVITKARERPSTSLYDRFTRGLACDVREGTRGYQAELHKADRADLPLRVKPQLFGRGARVQVASGRALGIAYEMASGRGQMEGDNIQRRMCW